MRRWNTGRRKLVKDCIVVKDPASIGNASRSRVYRIKYLDEYHKGQAEKGL